MASAPSEFGDYRLGRRIAVGGMAEIFRAERISDGTPVAIKLLLPQYARDPELVRMLADEARLQSSLSHPNLVRVLEFGRAGKQPYIALELVDGVSLREVLRAGPLPVPLALHVVAEVVRALVVVHAASVVHRDVTPENILCARTGEVRLGDFGIARSALAGGRTRTGIIKGKLAYLSPEQVTAGSIDARSDLYAVGLVLFEAIAGEAFLRGDTEPALLRAAESPVFRSSGHAALDDLLRSLLALAPPDRPPSASALLPRLDALGPDRAGLVERVEQALRTVIDDDEPRRGTVRVAARPPRRRWLTIAIVAVAAAGTVTAASLWLARDRSSTVRAIDAAVVAASTIDASGFAPIDTPAPPVADVQDTRFDAAAVVASDARAVRNDAAIAVAPVDTATPPDPAPVLAARLAQLRADLDGRGILEADLSDDARAALDRVRTAGTLEQGEAALADARRAFETTRIDERFVKRKLDRLNSAIRAADRAKVDVAELDRLAADALEDLLDRRYDACNKRLNQIDRLLR
jgi:serine/threonine-protein kinase